MMEKCISVAIVILLTFSMAVFAEGEGYHIIPPVGIDISPDWGIPPDGSAEFQVDSKLLEVPYEGIEQGTALVTAHVSSELRMASGVTVHNLTTDWIQDVVLTIENYGVFYGDPTGYIFLYDTVWNPPGLADGDIPAYPLGDIPPGGNAYAQVIMIPGFEPIHFDGQFDAESYGFNSPSPVPGFSDASVLFNSEVSWNHLFLPQIYRAH
jgi:hypothetical protein